MWSAESPSARPDRRARTAPELVFLAFSLALAGEDRLVDTPSKKARSVGGALHHRGQPVTSRASRNAFTRLPYRSDADPSSCSDTGKTTDSDNSEHIQQYTVSYRSKRSPIQSLTGTFQPLLAHSGLPRRSPETETRSRQPRSGDAPLPPRQDGEARSHTIYDSLPNGLAPGSPGTRGTQQPPGHRSGDTILH